MDLRMQSAVFALRAHSWLMFSLVPAVIVLWSWIMAATQLVISQIDLVYRVSPPGHRDFCFPLLKSLWPALRVLLDWDFIMHCLHSAFLFFTSYGLSFKDMLKLLLLHIQDNNEDTKQDSFLLAFGYCVYSLAEHSQLLSGLHYFPVNTLLFVHMYQITLALHILKLNRPLKLKKTVKV